MTVHVELVSPERIAYSGEADMVIARTQDGDAAFMAGHVPFIGALVTAPVRLVTDGSETAFAVHQGFIEVANGDDGTRVTVLSDTCELAADIDVPRAEAAVARAEAALAEDASDEDAAAALRRGRVRLAVAELR